MDRQTQVQQVQIEEFLLARIPEGWLGRLFPQREGGGGTGAVGVDIVTPPS